MRLFQQIFEILGLGDIMEGLLKPALLKKLVNFGALEAVAEKAATALTIEKFQEVGAVLQQVLFQDLDDIVGSFKQVFEVLELGDMMEGLVKPALQKKLR